MNQQEILDQLIQEEQGPDTQDHPPSLEKRLKDLEFCVVVSLIFGGLGFFLASCVIIHLVANAR